MPGDAMRPGLRLTIGARKGEVGRATAAWAEFAEAQGLPAEVRRSLHMALDELLHNAVIYGFAGQQDVAVDLGPDRVCVTLTDDGKPFDPFQVAPPDTMLSTQARRIGGLGIHLVRQMMDEVSYERRADRNVVVLTKLLAEKGQ